MGKKTLFDRLKQIAWGGPDRYVLTNRACRLINIVFWERPASKRSVSRPSNMWKYAVTEEYRNKLMENRNSKQTQRREIVNVAKIYNEFQSKKKTSQDAQINNTLLFSVTGRFFKVRKLIVMVQQYYISKL